MRDRIREGRYPDGKLPTIRELTREFGYAGQTVRDGMAILIGEGLVISAGNRGYFIASDETEAPQDNRDAGREFKEIRLQIQELADRVASLEERARSDDA